MPEKIKKLLSKLRPSGRFIVILMIFVLIGLWFYWFQWQPIQIRKFCYRDTFRKNSEWRKSNLEGNKEWGPEKKWMANPQQEKDAEWGWWYPIPNQLQADEFLYAKCLLEKGLKAEISISPLLKKGIR